MIALFHTDTSESVRFNSAFVELYLGRLVCFVLSFEAQMNVVFVMDTELRRRMRVTCLCFGFKMLITVTWCKATQVTLERIAFL